MKAIFSHATLAADKSPMEWRVPQLCKIWLALDCLFSFRITHSVSLLDRLNQLCKFTLKN
jgi:hypothetical protein